MVFGVLRRSAWITFTNCEAPPSGKIVAVDRGHDDMFEAELGSGDGDMLGLKRVDRARHAGLDVAEGAGPRAGVAEDHHRRMLLGPAFADVRAGRLLAHGREVERAHQPLGLGKAGAGRRLDADPVGLALPWLQDRVGFAHAGQIAIGGAACHPSPLGASAR